VIVVAVAMVAFLPLHLTQTVVAILGTFDVRCDHVDIDLADGGDVVDRLGAGEEVGGNTDHVVATRVGSAGAKISVVVALAFQFVAFQ